MALAHVSPRPQGSREGSAAPRAPSEGERLRVRRRQGSSEPGGHGQRHPPPPAPIARRRHARPPPTPAPRERPGAPSRDGWRELGGWFGSRRSSLTAWELWQTGTALAASASLAGSPRQLAGQLGSKIFSSFFVILDFLTHAYCIKYNLKK